MNVPNWFFSPRMPRRLTRWFNKPDQWDQPDDYDDYDDIHWDG